MGLDPGTYELGPPGASLRLRTFRQGLAAKAGHDLVIEATAWRATVLVPGDSGGAPSVTAEVDLRHLVVVRGTGGVKPLTEGDKQEIHKAMQKPLRTADHPIATFRSTAVRIEGDEATIDGELTLAGQTQPVELRVHRDGDRTILCDAEIVQSAWGIKPYTGFFGALKLRDAVDVELSAPLPL